MTRGASYPTLTGDGARKLLASEDRVVVAGAGGWIGLAALEQLHQLLGPADFSRRVFAFGSNRRRLTLRGGLEVDQAALLELSRLPAAPTLVLHLAFLTQEKAGQMSRDKYISTNRLISDQVFDSLDPIGARGVFVASSGAVELAAVSGAHANKALYGKLKLDDEERFGKWAEQRAARAVVARIFGLSGPYINKVESYALACFVNDVLANRPINISADHPVYRSYVAVDELMSVVFGLLLDGEHGTIVFDTGMTRGYEMGEIAQGVARALGHEAGIQRPTVRKEGEDRYVGDGRRYEHFRDKLGVRRVGFGDQARETAKYLRSDTR